MKTKWGGTKGAQGMFAPALESAMNGTGTETDRS
jgi:hypothetical protein